MFEFFTRGRKNIPKPPPIDTTTRTVPGIIVPGAVMLKPKKWVAVNNQVGIVTEIDASGYVKVDLVNAEGYTISTTRVPVGQIRLARYLEIPASRRGDQVLAATKGYV